MRFFRAQLQILLFPLLLIPACNNCKDIACFTPPEPFVFELVDKTSGENLFANGTLTSDEIIITNTDNNNIIDYTFISENDLNLIQINTIGWETESINYLFQVSDFELFTLTVEAERVNEDCCSFTRYNEIEIEGAEYTFNDKKGIYSILIEL